MICLQLNSLYDGVIVAELSTRLLLPADLSTGDLFVAELCTSDLFAAELFM